MIFNLGFDMHIVEELKEFEELYTKKEKILFLGKNEIIIHLDSLYHFKYEELIEFGLTLDKKYLGNSSKYDYNMYLKIENKYGLKKEIEVKDNIADENYETYRNYHKINNVIKEKRKEYVINSILNNI